MILYNYENVWPPTKPYQVEPPSLETNEYTSVAFAALETYGATPLGHFKVLLVKVQVTILPPVASCDIIIVKVLALPAVGLLIVKLLTLAVRELLNTVPVLKSIVITLADGLAVV
jgi:hypothetical protein